MKNKKTLERLYKFLPHMVFLALIVLILAPAAVEIKNRWIFFGIVILIEAVLIMYRKSKSAHDTVFIVFLFLVIWEICTTKTNRANTMLVPPPERVFAIFISDWKKILDGVFSSGRLLFTAFFFALLLGIGLGMLTGWFERPRKAFFPIAKIISPIPAIIYSPYAIALLPSFRAASLFIVFSSIFWPVYMNMIICVSTVDRRILESARTLNIGSLSMFLHVLFPYSLPRLISGLSVTLSMSFMVLTAAELVGGTSGLGWYVKYYADFADYTRVVAGIILIGVAVTVLNKLLLTIEKLLIKWK